METFNSLFLCSSKYSFTYLYLEANSFLDYSPLKVYSPIHVNRCHIFAFGRLQKIALAKHSKVFRCSGSSI